MNIDGTFSKEIKDYLSEQFKSGYKWVAFSGFRPYLIQSELKCFRDYSSLERHCEDAFDDFKPISNVLRKLSPEQYESGKTPDTEQIRAEIEKYQVEAFKPDEDLVRQIAKCELYPVLLIRSVEPEVEIHKYNVYEHTHPGHQVYEKGHDVGLLQYFEKQEEAIGYWNDLIEIYNESEKFKKPDLIMVAEFKNQKPELDVEGIPIRNSAVLLKTGYPILNEEGKRPYKVDDWQMNSNSFQLKEPAFAKFNTQTNQLEFFNSNLAKVNPGDKIDYMDLNFFSTKEVLISSSLNQRLHKDNMNEALPDSQKQQHRLNKGL